MRQDIDPEAEEKATRANNAEIKRLQMESKMTTVEDLKTEDDKDFYKVEYEACKAVIDSALDELELITGLKNSGLHDNIAALRAELEKVKSERDETVIRLAEVKLALGTAECKLAALRKSEKD